MYPLPKYHPLDHPLHFEATFRTETHAGGTRTETQLSYPLTIGPAKQDWGLYALSVKRGETIYAGYTPNKADEVVHLLGQPLHHLEITFDTHGRPLKLRNHVAVWQRWQEETAPVIRLAYAGEWVESKIVDMEQGLFNADALLQKILRRDLILNALFTPLQLGADGSDIHLPISLFGGEINLPNRVHIHAETAGNTTLEITAAGPASGGQKEWEKLLPKYQRDGELKEAPRIQKRCVYTLPAANLWPVGFECKWDIAGLENTRKSIYLQLVLL